jgi:hypothetical protein
MVRDLCGDLDIVDSQARALTGKSRKTLQYISGLLNAGNDA